MSIVEADVVFRKSQRMTDFPDGGGLMSTATVVDGVDNNLFDDITDLHRLFGHLSLRKVYGAVLSNNADTYISAHALVDVPPTDAATDCFVFATGGLATERAAALSYITSNNRVYGSAVFPGALASGAVSGVVSKVTAVTQPVTEVPQSSPSGSLAVSAQSWFEVAESLGARLYETAPGTNPGQSDWVIGFGATFYRNLALPAYPGITNGSATYLNGSGASATSTSVLVGAPGVANVIVSAGPGYTTGSMTGGTYKVQFLVPLPAENVRLVVTAANRASSYSIMLPADTAPGSEYVRLNGVNYAWTQQGKTTLYSVTSGIPVGTINRTTGEVAVTFAGLLSLGDRLEVTYARNTVTKLPFGALSNSGVMQTGGLTVTLTPGKSLLSAAFAVGGVMFQLSGTSVYRTNPLSAFTPELRGSYNPTTKVLDLPFDVGATITNWHAYEAVDRVVYVAATALAQNIRLSTLSVSGTTAAGVAFSATPNDLGVFSTAVVSGSYDSATGELALTFAGGVFSDTLVYSGSVFGASTAGSVMLQSGDAALIHSTLAMSPATVSNGSTTTTGRTSLSRLRVIGSNGVVHASFVLNQPAPVGVGCTADLAAGTVSFTDVSGMSQPVTVEHRIEEMVIAQSVVANTKVVSFNRPLSRAYPAGTRVSSLLMLGDLQARVGVAFAQQAWTGVFSDTVLGGTPAADYNIAANPIVVTNQGAVNERWYVQFTNTTTFTLVGEQLGVIGTFGTGSACAPINPATGVPYFSIAAVGWGSGWAAGNIYRFNTSGANAPIWAGRSVAPSTPSGDDSVTLQLRGYVNT